MLIVVLGFIWNLVQAKYVKTANHIAGTAEGKHLSQPRNNQACQEILLIILPVMMIF
jgi:hypothetical protein